MNKLQEKLKDWQARSSTRKARKRRRAVETVADTTAAGVGLVLWLSVRVILTVLLVVLTTAVLLICIFAFYVKTCLSGEIVDVTLEEVSMAQSSIIWYTDSDGNLQELTTLYSDENRVWVDYEDIPIYMEYAAVAIEDARFYTHKGVDWYRTVGAFVNMFVGMKNTFGGSTITQQLIKNLTEYDDVTVQRKLLEIFSALEFEKKYTKEEIMTWYLNEIYLGGQCYGVRTAAQRYFAKDVSELTLAECACIIGITNNPSMYDPYISDTTREANKTRQETILWEMYDQGYITYEEYIDAVNEELVFQKGDTITRTSEVTSYYEDTVIREVIEDLMEEKGVSETVATRLLYNSGYNIYACIDTRIQDIVDNMYENLYNLPSSYRSSSQQLQSAIVIIDPSNGDIVAISGGTGEKEYTLSLNRATQSKRPPGSSIKPLSVYSPAIDLGLVTPDDYINDSPNITLSGTSWYPSNSGNSYSGLITIRQALINSKNTVAAQLLDKLGLDASWSYLTEHFGFTSLVRDYYDESTGQTLTDYAYAPLALGQFSYGVTVLEMAQAYTAFVNDGTMVYGRSYYMVTDSDGEIVLQNDTETINSLKVDTARNMALMLQDAVSYGTGTDAYFSTTAVGGKTGTTSDDYDRYFVGITSYYVAAVWTGYDTPSQMYFSGNPAAQIFKSIMSQVLQGYEYKSFPEPSNSSSTTNLFAATATETPEPSETPEVTETPEASPPEAVTTDDASGTNTTTATPVEPTEAVTTEAPVEPTEAVATDAPVETTETIVTDTPVETDNSGDTGNTDTPPDAVG